MREKSEEIHFGARRLSDAMRVVISADSDRGTANGIAFLMINAMYLFTLR